MALFFSPAISSSLQNPNFIPKFSFSLLSTNRFSLLSTNRFSLLSTNRFSLLSSVSRASSSDDSGITSPATATATTVAVEVTEPVAEIVKESPPSKPAIKTEEISGEEMKKTTDIKFEDPRWVNGTWDLKKFEKNGKTDWDSVIVAEAKRRKWLEDNPETTSNDELVIFDTSIIPWWAWIKRYHLPEAELLNGRAAMIGFFMAYFVDSLTGVGLVDQMGNFFCKTLLFVAVVGVLFIRKNEDVEKLKKLFDETTLYDKQWQAAWKDDDDESFGSNK